MGDGQPLAKAAIVGDVLGKSKLLAWPNANTDVVELELRAKEALGTHWAGLWSAAGADKDDLAFYDEIWNRAREISPQLRRLERTRTPGYWLADPAQPIWGRDEGPPLVAFYSFKGGVGRTTALIAFALQRAKAGESVVVIDGDLEAPGLGPLLGSAGGEGPGVADYLLDAALDENLAIDAYFRRYQESSRGEGSITGAGEIRVFPAGKLDSDYLAILARLDLADAGADEHPIRRLLRSVRTELRPDWILLDCRAGISEISGIALSGLAHLAVVCATASEQSWDGVELVVKQLGEERLLRGLGQSDCILVQTMVPETDQGAATGSFLDRAEELFRGHYYLDDEHKDSESWSVDDMGNRDAPHQPVVIRYSAQLAFYRALTEVAGLLTAGEGYVELGNRIVARRAEPAE